MRSLKERIGSVTEDPIKLRRAFTVGWIISYLMLILGFILMVWVFFNESQ
ncbi:MAG: hypothetical protein LBS92_02870 [Candidatus Methanoplasma sp.]|nr:hypothetical protein [Candidatus Methanoplasma sp.]